MLPAMKPICVWNRTLRWVDTIKVPSKNLSKFSWSKFDQSLVSFASDRLIPIQV